MRPAELIQRLKPWLGLHASHSIDACEFLEDLLVIDNGCADDAGGDFRC